MIGQFKIGHETKAGANFRPELPSSLMRCLQVRHCQASADENMKQVDRSQVKIHAEIR